jgi:ribosomal protein S18 acetylase RimI-like enzyme
MVPTRPAPGCLAPGEHVESDRRACLSPAAAGCAANGVSLRLAELARIEDAGLNASAPPQQRLLDGWLLRFSPGKAKRARCINALSAGRLPLAEKLASCEQAYALAGLPMIVRITPFSAPQGLDGALADSGLLRFDDTRVMVLPSLQDLEGIPLDEPRLCGVSAQDYAHAIGTLRGSSPEQRAAHGERLRLAPVPHRGFLLRRGGAVVACGQYAVESEIVGLYDVFTAPAARGRGLARLLCTELLRRARAAGARRAYLQVEADNRPARAVYRRLGFADAYAYHYRARDLQA